MTPLLHSPVRLPRPLRAALLVALLAGFAAPALAQTDALSPPSAGAPAESAPARPAPAPPTRAALLRQVAGILDYIGSDYAGAVDASGTIVSQGEYDEQLSLTDEALELAASAGLAASDDVTIGLLTLRKLLESVPPPGPVLETCRTIRSALVDGHGLVLEPSVPPDRARAVELWTVEKCGTCHGDRGDADTDRARELERDGEAVPANFLDPERIAGVSPHRALHAITFGVSGTSMPAYDYLSASDRWSLAFWVLSLRHADAERDAGKRAFEAADRPLSPSARRLSQLTEDDVRAALVAAGLEGAQGEQALSWLRHDAPFVQSTGGSFALAQEKIRAAVAAHAAGDVSGARSLLVSAYLDGVEPHEASLRARSPALVRDIERAMMALRDGVGRGKTPAEVEALATRAASLLDRAEEGRLSRTGAFVGSLVIALREGFEAALLLTALLAIARRKGVPRLERFAHAGWIAAVIAGFVTWFAAGHLLGGMSRELAEGIIAIAAALVLLVVTHWTLGQVSSRQVLGFLARRLSAATGGASAAWGAFVLAFVAVYREAFEVVLFYRALLLDAGDARGAVWAGAAVGIVALVIIVLVLRALGRRLPTRAFMAVSSVLLAFIAFALIGKGVHALQEAGVLSMTIVSDFELPLVGFFASAEGLVAQAVLVLVLVASAVWTLLFAGTARPPGSPATP